MVNFCVQSHQNDAHVGSYMFLIWLGLNNPRNAEIPLNVSLFNKYGGPLVLGHSIHGFPSVLKDLFLLSSQLRGHKSKL